MGRERHRIAAMGQRHRSQFGGNRRVLMATLGKQRVGAQANKALQHSRVVTNMCCPVEAPMN